MEACHAQQRQGESDATDAFDLTAVRILKALDQIGYLDDYVMLKDEQSNGSAVV